MIWEHPELRGRVAFDARFELLTSKQLRSIVYFRLRIGDWRAPTRHYALLVLNSSDEKDQIRVLLSGKEARPLYRGGGISVLDRTKG